MKVLLKTLAARLTAWYAGIFILFVGAAFVFFYVLIGSILDRQLDEDLEEDIVEFRLLWRSDGPERVKEEMDREVRSNEPGEVLLRLVDRTGKEIFAPDMPRWRGKAIDNQALDQVSRDGEPVLRTVHVKGEDYPTRVVYGLISPGAVLQIGESTEDNAEFMELLLKVFAGTFCVVMVLAAWVGWFMARRALLGVEEVSRAAEDITRGALDRKVSVKAKGSEIERLVSTFNVMVERTRSLISGMREMTDNIAHDMRSPLARIRANAELALSNAKSVDEFRESAADTLEECDRLLEMINTTLDVAEAEAGAADVAKQDIDVSETVRDACELFEPLAENKDIEMSLDMAPGCRVYGNIRYLQRMFANLLDNAVKFTPPKGRIFVTVRSEDGTVAASIGDTGIGIVETDQTHIFERFYRCDQSRSQPGFGLGLSFSRAVARAHGGDVVVSSKPGVGSTFTVKLPAVGTETLSRPSPSGVSMSAATCRTPPAH